MKVGVSPGLTPGPLPSPPYPMLLCRPSSMAPLYPQPTRVCKRRLTFLGYLPELKGNFEGLSYCEGDSLGLKNRKWGQGRGAVLGR